jgi:hypothetical protein
MEISELDCHMEGHLDVLGTLSCWHLVPTAAPSRALQVSFSMSDPGDTEVLEKQEVREKLSGPRVTGTEKEVEYKVESLLIHSPLTGVRRYLPGSRQPVWLSQSSKSEAWPAPEDRHQQGQEPAACLTVS